MKKISLSLALILSLALQVYAQQTVTKRDEFGRMATYNIGGKRPAPTRENPSRIQTARETNTGQPYTHNQAYTREYRSRNARGYTSSNYSSTQEKIYVYPYEQSYASGGRSSAWEFGGNLANSFLYGNGYYGYNRFGYGPNLGFGLGLGNYTLASPVLDGLNDLRYRVNSGSYYGYSYGLNRPFGYSQFGGSFLRY